MIYLFEGVDETGKTTTAQQLAETFSVEWVHSVKQDNVEKAIEDSLRHSGRSDVLILDRIPVVSEYIYGPTIDNRKWLALGEVIDVMCKIAPVHIFHCLPSSFALARHETDNKIYAKYYELIEKYLALMEIFKNYFPVTALKPRNGKDGQIAHGIILDHVRRYNLR